MQRDLMIAIKTKTCLLLLISTKIYVEYGKKAQWPQKKDRDQNSGNRVVLLTYLGLAENDVIELRHFQFMIFSRRGVFIFHLQRFDH